MTIYVLVIICEREITIKHYYSYEKAYKEMKNDIDKLINCDCTNQRKASLMGWNKGIDYDIDEYGSWANTAHGTYDSLIQKIQV